jgi:hypothetical protein
MAPANNAVGNLPDREPLRWTAAKAAREHGVTPYLMLKRLKDGGEAPDREGCYATSQIIKVLYGSLHTEGLRKVATEADGVELANAITRTEFLNRADLEDGFGRIATAMVQIIRRSTLDQPSQDDLLSQLSSFRVVVESVARRQDKRLANGSNGDTPSPALRGKTGPLLNGKKSGQEASGRGTRYLKMHDLAQTTRIAGEHFFNSGAVEDLIADFQRSGSRDTLGAIITLCEPIALSLIRSRATSVYEPETDLMAAVNEKLLWSLPRFDPERGRAFAFVSRTVINTLCTRVSYQKKMASRFSPLDDALVATVADERAAFSSQVAVDDLVQRIRSIKSACTLPAERAAQVWFTESFLDCGFELRRHECADAAMKVYGLCHRRARDLYDLTLLEIRRTVWDETKHREVDAGTLKGTKGTRSCVTPTF